MELRLLVGLLLRRSRHQLVQQQGPRTPHTNVPTLSPMPPFASGHRTTTRILARASLLATLVLAAPILYLEGCAPRGTIDVEDAASADRQLDDGTYSCDASNVSRGNGPYT